MLHFGPLRGGCLLLLRLQFPTLPNHRLKELNNLLNLLFLVLEPVSLQVFLPVLLYD